MSGPTSLSEWESKRLLGEDLPRPPELRATTSEEAAAFAAEHGRVVAKASGVAHKSDAGLVRLGLDAQGVAGVFAELAAAGDGGVLVAVQLEDAELELIVGGTRDPVFGPVLSVGVGGIAAEVLGDVAHLLAPPRDGELEQAIGQLRGAALFEGIRGRPPVDREALARIVGSVARLLVGRQDVVEIDCNPVLVVHGSPVVVDALVVRDGDGGPVQEQR